MDQQQQLPQPLFGLVAAGQPVLTQPTETPSPASFVYTIPAPADKASSHVVVFLLPGVALPAGTAAAIYLVEQQVAPPTLQFLGGVGPGKESAIFRLSVSAAAGAAGPAFVLGIAIEPADSVAERIAERAGVRTEQSFHGSSAGGVASQKPDALRLAQRIVQNAFNFLAGFSGRAGGGVEVVPLKAFEDWWRKFETRIRTDPGFLERDT